MSSCVVLCCVAPVCGCVYYAVAHHILQTAVRIDFNFLMAALHCCVSVFSDWLQAVCCVWFVCFVLVALTVLSQSARSLPMSDKHAVGLVGSCKAPPYDQVWVGTQDLPVLGWIMFVEMGSCALLRLLSLL